MSTAIELWPKTEGLLAYSQTSTFTGRQWNNISKHDFIGILGSCLHQLKQHDAVKIHLTFNADFSAISTLHIKQSMSVMTEMDAYSFDDLNELIINEELEQKQQYNISLICQIYGDFWLFK